MIGKKIEDCTQNGAICEACTQFVRRKPGQAKESFRPVAVGKHPAERLQSKRRRIGC